MTDSAAEILEMPSASERPTRQTCKTKTDGVIRGKRNWGARKQCQLASRAISYPCSSLANVKRQDVAPNGEFRIPRRYTNDSVQSTSKSLSLGCVNSPPRPELLLQSAYSSWIRETPWRCSRWYFNSFVSDIKTDYESWWTGRRVSASFNLSQGKDSWGQRKPNT